MGDTSQLLKAIDLLYGSILDDEDFLPALAAVSDFGHARGAYCLTFDRQSGEALDSKSVGVDAAAQTEYLEHYSAQDLRVPAALHEPVGALVTEHKLVNQDVFEASELYQDFLRRHDIPHFLALWTQKSQTRLSALALQRGSGQGAFLRSDEERLAPLVPHLVRALRIRDAMQSTRAASAAYAEVIDRLPFGVVTLDWARSPIEISSVAERLFQSSRIILCKNGRVCAARAADDSRLQRAVYLAMAGEASHGDVGLSLTLLDRRGARSLRVTVIPVSKPHPFMRECPACMLLIFDPDRLPGPSIEMLMKSLHLTRAEARLARELSRGVSLREAAATLQLSVNTCKTQLKSIYARTGFRSHAELAKAVVITGLAQSASGIENR